MREWWQRLFAMRQFDARSTRLSWLLAGINVVLVLLVLAAMSWSAIGLLRDLADQQALSRVQLAGATAREELRKASEDIQTTARVLASRPTLARLLTENQTAELTPVLRRLCETNTADSCALVVDQNVIASTTTDVPWPQVFAAQAEQGERFFAAPSAVEAALFGATAAIAGHPQARVFVLRWMRGSLARQLATRAGLEIRIVSYRAYDKSADDAFARLHAAGLVEGSSVARIDDPDIYASSYPVFAATGEPIALIETRLPADELDSYVATLIRRLLLSAVVFGVIALIVGLYLGRRVAQPVRELTEAAVRLGHGDFSTSIPTRGAAEVGTLANTMEDMRRNLVELTSTLRRREAEARAVLGGIVEGVYAVDAERRIRFLNPQAEKLLGIRSEEAIGRFCGDVLKPCDVDGARPCETQCPIVLARASGSSRAVERLMTSGGTQRTTVITSAAPADDLQVQVIRDETELEAVRRARDTVLANISHEFRTPLAAQLASIELLRDGIDDMRPEQRAELLRSLERGALRLTRLIDNLLESVRIEAGQLGIRRQSVALADIIEDARAMVASLIAQRRQELAVELPDDLPSVDGDEARLAQVFVNLLANASKYAPEGSSIRVGAEVRDAQVGAWVEDEGPGVPEGERGLIFERFSRARESEPEPGGLGLGLWISRSIMERHGGSIDVSRTESQRTRFTVTLPTAALSE
ncbi:MAG: ATP-binding protein [Steroidobacteraceae bacterium]